MKRLHCPDCKQKIPSASIDIAKNKADCANCGKQYAASELFHANGDDQFQKEQDGRSTTTDPEHLWEDVEQAKELFGIRFPSRQDYEHFKENHLRPVLQNLGKKVQKQADHRLHPLYQKTFRRIIEIAVVGGGVYLLYAQLYFFAFYLAGYGVLLWFALNAFFTKANKRWKTIRNILVIAALPLLFSSIFFYLLMYSGFAVAILEVGVPMGIQQQEDADFQEGYKSSLLEPTLQFIDNRFTYTIHDGFPKEDVDQSLVFPFKAKYYSAEDDVSINANGLDLAFCDIMMSNTSHDANVVAFSRQQRDRSNKHLHRQSARDEMFRGLFFRINLQQDIACTIAIRPTSFEWTMEKRGQEQTDNLDKEDVWLLPYDPAKRLQDPESGAQLKEVSLNAPRFTNQFKVYTSDEGRLDNMLTNDTINQLLSLSQHWGEGVFVACRGSSLYLALEMKRSIFEPRLNGRQNPEEQEFELDRFYTNFRRVLDFAATFQQVGQTI